MRFQRFGDRFLVRLESGDRVLESLNALLRAERIGFAWINGLGALRWVRLSYWNAQTLEYEPHEYEEQVEVVSLIGNAALRDGDPALHLHISLGRADLSMFGGHFNEGIVHPNLEVWLRPEQGEVVRALEPEFGAAPLMQLPERLAG
jgi:predicted DNA-binding protein with PD1-like motif